MKKLVCFGLCFLIVISSFVFCFAWVDEPNPSILPSGDDDLVNSSFAVLYNDNLNRYFWSNDPTTYIIFYNSSTTSNQAYYLVFSENPSAVLYNSKEGTSGINSFSLSNYYDGYYYYRSGQPLASYDNVYLSDSISPTSVIDAVNNTVFSTTFSLSSLVEGSVNWLSTMAQAVKSSGFLLFMVLISFIGIGIGLLNRFRR